MPRIDLRRLMSREGRLYVRSVYGAMLMVVVGGLVIPALLASYFLLAVQERRNSVAELDDTLQRNASILALGMQESLRSMNGAAARALIDSVMRDPSVVRIQIRSSLDTGVIDVRAPARAQGRVLRAERAIVMGGRHSGSVTIEMDDLRSEQDLRRKQRNYALVLAVQVLVSLLLILTFLRRRLQAPLRTLAGFSDRLSGGDFDTPLQLDVPGELGRLGMWRQLGETGFWRGELWSTRKDGGSFLEWLTVSTVRNDEGRVTHYVGVFSDITRLKQSQDELDYLAHHDPLTGLPNRLLFQDRLLYAIGRATREHQQLAVMFIDLDRFKNVNDTLGHHVGDELLEQVAGALHACLREGDTLARLGGDEFIVLLENVDGSYGAGQVATKMMALFEQPFNVAGHELFSTGSIGIALFPGDGQEPNLLVRNADVAMYQAKSRGRNGYRFYAPEMDGEGVERLRMEALLRRAIEREEIFVHYQPQVDIASRRLIGVEALVRWHNPELGPVSPVRFIPMAEDTGFINQLGEWVLFEACRQMVRWDEAGLAVPKMAVNLSVRQVERGAMTPLVARVLAETRLAPHRLQLEVTESLIMNTGDASAFVHELHALGVDLAIDDFGTGYSSLAYLKQLPVDVLKIDRSFIKDIALDANDEAIAIAIIQLGKSMNLSVIAEGVENEEQAAFLLRHGCTRAQGYLYGRPVAPGELLQEWGQEKNEGFEYNDGGGGGDTVA